MKYDFRVRPRIRKDLTNMLVKVMKEIVKPEFGSMPTIELETELFDMLYKWIDKFDITRLGSNKKKVRKIPKIKGESKNGKQDISD